MADPAEDQIDPFVTFDESRSTADCMTFDPVVRPYHRPHLERASEGNPNNARIPVARGKGYSECLEYGWIAELEHPSAGYAFFEITELGEAALRKRSAKKFLRRVRLALMPERLGSLPPRLGPP